GSLAWGRLFPRQSSSEADSRGRFSLWLGLAFNSHKISHHVQVALSHDLPTDRRIFHFGLFNQTRPEIGIQVYARHLFGEGPCIIWLKVGERLLAKAVSYGLEP